MKNRSLSTISLALLVLLLFLGTILSGVAQGPSAPQKLDLSDLTLKITSTKEVFVELEPIPIILNLRNESSQTILAHSALDLSNNFVKLFIIEEGGQTREIQNVSPVTGNTAAAPREIGPGESLEAKQALAFHLDKTFPRSGDYRIQALLYDAGWTSEIKSNVLTIHILQPEGLNFEALKYIKSLGASSYFFSGVGFPSEEEERTALEVFTTKFGETLYGDYAGFSLGERYYYDMEYTRAEKQFSLLANKADFVFADRAKKYLEKIKKDNALSSETP